MKSSKNDKLMEHGRIIARAMNELKVEHKKNMIKAVQQRAERLEQAAEIELFKTNI
jgi:hypothetical protein